jgi:hypothetical protein
MNTTMNPDSVGVKDVARNLQNLDPAKMARGNQLQHSLKKKKSHLLPHFVTSCTCAPEPQTLRY